MEQVAMNFDQETLILEHKWCEKITLDGSTKVVIDVNPISSQVCVEAYQIRPGSHVVSVLATDDDANLIHLSGILTVANNEQYKTVDLYIGGKHIATYAKATTSVSINLKHRTNNGFYEFLMAVRQLVIKGS